MSIEDDNNIPRFRIDINESSSFYFCDHFYESFKQKSTDKAVTVIKEYKRKEVIAYYAECGK